MIMSSHVRRAEYVVDSSGIVGILEDAMRRDRRGRKPATATLRLLLVGMYLSVHHLGSLTLTDVLEVLTRRLPRDEQVRLGIVTRTALGTKILNYKQLVYQANRVMTSLAYGHGSARDVDAVERARRHAAVTSSLAALMDVFDLGWETDAMALDATGIWSWAKGGRKNAPVVRIDDGDDFDLAEETAALLEQAQRTGIIPDKLIELTDRAREAEKRALAIAASQAASTKAKLEAEEATEVGRLSVPSFSASHDPDAAWGVKTAKSGRSEVFFGYHEHTLVIAPNKKAGDGGDPVLIRRLELTPASEDVVDVSLRLIDSCTTGFGLLLVDMLYSHKDAARWFLPLVSRRVRMVHDLRVKEQGFTEFERMRFAAGCAHCPATPDSLGLIAKPGLFASEAVWEFFHAEIDKRFDYAMRVVNQADESGAIRFQCPAEAGKIGCPLRAGSVQSALEKGQRVIENPPTTAAGEKLPACCTQVTVLVRPPNKVLKLAQPHYWGSRQWRKLFARRTYVEGTYGNRKNPSTENMRRGVFRSVGIVWANLAIGMTAASYNTRMLQNWHDRTGGHAGHPLLVPDDEFHGFVYLTEGQSAAVTAAAFAELDQCAAGEVAA
jgi:hypothetical protein